MTAQYFFHYDVNFDVAIRRDEREKIKQSLLDFLQPYSKEQKMRVRSPKKHLVSLKKDKCEFHIMVKKFFHVGMSLDRLTEKEIELANEVSNKIIGFTTTMPNRNIRLVELNAIIERKIDKNVIPTIIEARSMADLSSKLKMDIRPLAVAFRSRKDGTEILTTFFHYRKERILNLSLNKKLKEAPWGIIPKIYEDINSLINTIVYALGVKIEDG